MPRQTPAPDSREALCGAAIKDLREQRGLTQTELAGYCGAATRGVVASWESGDRAPPLWRLVELAAGLGVEPEELASAIAAKLRDAK